MESLALSGGLLGLVAGIELVLAPVILSVGAGGGAMLFCYWDGLEARASSAGIYGCAGLDRGTSGDDA